MLYHLSLVLIASLSGADVSEQDVKDVIATQRQTSVYTFMQRVPPPAKEKEFRESIHRNLPMEFSSRIVDDSRDTELLREVLGACADPLRPFGILRHCNCHRSDTPDDERFGSCIACYDTVDRKSTR